KAIRHGTETPSRACHLVVGTWKAGRDSDGDDVRDSTTPPLPMGQHRPDLSRSPGNLWESQTLGGDRVQSLLGELPVVSQGDRSRLRPLAPLAEHGPLVVGGGVSWTLIARCFAP